ncbi:MAG TPA: transglycosylase SLT domain-containing protein, partial [Polyangiaceae bacterium]
MSTPENASGSGAPGADRVRLLIDLGACLAAWRRALAQGVRPSNPEIAGLRGLSADLQARLPAVGFGGIAVHLRELVRRYDAWGAAGDVRESIEALLHLSEQARLSLTPHEQALLDRPALPRPAAVRGEAQPAAGPKPPPMITMGRSDAGEPEPRRAQSGILPAAQLSGPVSVRPPRLLDSGIIRGPSERPPELPAFAPPGQGLPYAGQHPAPPPAAVFGGAPPAYSAPPGGPPFPAPAPPQNGSFQVASAPPPAAKPTNAPNLLVRSMLGLRAFGRAGKPVSGGLSAAPSPSFDSGSSEPRGSLLGLKRSSSSGLSEAPSVPPLLDRSPSGLPPLPPSPSVPPRDALHSAPGLESPAGRMSGSRGVQDLLSGIERSRSGGGRRSERPRTSSMLRHHEDEGGGWRVGAIAAAILALVLGGITTLVIVLTRQSDDSERPVTRASNSETPAGEPKALASTELPRPKLLNESESFRALLSQVHGRGKESPQLRALVDEQAALAARAVSAQACEGTAAACEEWAKIREALVGNQGVKRITRRRTAGSPDRIRSRWLVGLKLPEIPVEDDPRVQRSFEFYTENPVGRETFQAMLFRCGAHRDLIQSTLIRHGLPADLLAIVFVESGCEPQATSPVGAAGLWQ